MKPQKSATDDTEKRNFRFFKSSMDSVVASSQKEYSLKEVFKSFLSALCGGFLTMRIENKGVRDVK